ncbi:MAG TPA: MFS transporter [Isosphaeraceae bacterium]|jgi:PAT family beta-lactamase induction signal transducer AmpG
MSRPERVRPAYLILFAALYAIQGVVVAYFFNYNQGYMSAAGVAERTIGLVEFLVTIPLIVKFLGGVLSDRVNLLGFGHRKPYIVLGLALQGLGLLGLVWVDPGRHLAAFAALAVLAVAGLALYDTCCDGMVLDVTPPADRARVQGMLVAARFLAAMACSYGFGKGLKLSGNGPGAGDWVLQTCAALSVMVLMRALTVPEPRPSADAEAFQWAALGALVRPQALGILAFGGLYATVAYGVEINLSLFYAARRFDADAIGAFSGARYLGRAVGGALLSLAGPRLGRGTTLALGVLGLAAATAGQGAVAGWGLAVLMGFLFGVANGWDDALFNVLAMEAADPRLAASTFALFMAITNLSTAGGAIVAAAVAATGGRYDVVFLRSGLVALAALLLVPPLRRPAGAKPEPLDVDA